MGKIEWAGESTAALAVSDYGRSLAWYRDVLGLKVVFELETWGWAQLQSPVDGLLVGIGQSEEVKTGGGATLTFTVEDIEAARAYLEGEGVRFDGEISQVEDMVRLTTFYDPDGNALMLAQQLNRGESRPVHGAAVPERRRRRTRSPTRSSTGSSRATCDFVALAAAAGSTRTGRSATSPTRRCAASASCAPSIEETLAAVQADPAVIAGRMRAEVFTWLVPEGMLPFGSPRLARVRILIAEDETIIRLDLRSLLEGAGFEVCAEAKDGLEAVELARSERARPRDARREDAAPRRDRGGAADPRRAADPDRDADRLRPGRARRRARSRRACSATW